MSSCYAKLTLAIRYVHLDNGMSDDVILHIRIFLPLSLLIGELVLVLDELFENGVVSGGLISAR